MLCAICRVAKPMYGDSRCEDCWAGAAQTWRWRGDGSLDIRHARRKASDGDLLEKFMEPDLHSTEKHLR